MWQKFRKRRISRDCAPSIQTEGSDGGPLQRSETSLLLLKAGRKTPSETGFGEEARARKIRKEGSLARTRAGNSADRNPQL